MKKILIVLAILIVGIFSVQDKEDYYVIPKDAIRFRIIANSNSVNDQYIKYKVKDKLEESFQSDISISSSLDETRKIINNNLDNYYNIVTNVFQEENYNKEFEINYGMNYFPEKEYKGVKYEEGEYESLVVTIGNGEGDNFWCLLFPPMCSLEVEESQSEDIEYKFFIKEIIDKYFN